MKDVWHDAATSNASYGITRQISGHILNKKAKAGHGQEGHRHQRERRGEKIVMCVKVDGIRRQEGESEVML